MEKCVKPDQNILGIYYMYELYNILIPISFHISMDHYFTGKFITLITFDFCLLNLWIILSIDLLPEIKYLGKKCVWTGLDFFPHSPFIFFFQS